MHTITLPYPLFVLLLVLLVIAVATACTLIAIVRVQRQTVARLSTAYAELTAGSQRREEQLLSERNTAILRAESAEADADRLAPLVARWVKDIDDTAELMRDPQAPALTAERDALRAHEEALAARGASSLNPISATQ